MRESADAPNRNMRRKKRRPVLKIWHYLFIFLAGIYLLYWQQNQVVHLGYRIGDAQTRHKNLLAENKQLQAEALLLKNASAIRRRLKDRGLNLVEPSYWNIYYLEEWEP